MSMTKRYIETLHDRAGNGDEEAARVLDAAGLREPTEEELREEAEAYYSTVAP